VTIRAKIVKLTPCVTVTGEVMERVTATNPAKAPLRMRIRVRSRLGSSETRATD
jgi:hypothetical protein